MTSVFQTVLTVSVVFCCQVIFSADSGVKDLPRVQRISTFPAKPDEAPLLADRGRVPALGKRGRSPSFQEDPADPSAAASCATAATSTLDQRGEVPLVKRPTPAVGEAAAFEALIDQLGALSLKACKAEADASLSEAAKELIKSLKADIQVTTETIAAVMQKYNDKAEQIRRTDPATCPFDPKLEREMGALRRRVEILTASLQEVMSGSVDE